MYYNDKSPTLQWDTVTARKGRNDYPHLLSEHFYELDPSDRARAVTESWAMAEWPQRHLEYEEWISLFHNAGLVNAVNLPGPTVTLYRGCHVSRRRGMSWSTDRERALWFALRFNKKGEDHMVLMEVECPVEYVLALIEDRGEREAVVDIDALYDDGLFTPTFLPLKEAS